MHLEIEGVGPDLVLLHGWGLRLEVWDGLVGSLRERFRVIRADLPGHGRSRDATQLDADALIPELEAVLEPPACWVGWSLGGLLALQLCALRPAWFVRLGLVGCNPCFVQRPDWPGMAPEVFEAFVAGVRGDPGATWKRFLALVAQGDGQREVLRSLRRTAGEFPPATDALVQGLELLAHTDARPTTAGCCVPVHWLLGTADALVPAATADGLAGLTGAESVTRIEGAGHAPFLSHPKIFNQWLGRLAK
ncbi:pimeloyl-[acyl-carrier protein] methyl ester esterase [Thiohalobacter thiocyanaticus]|uniref:Pimeloyl-[acyl-carrier protein] methyl ester esterase n=1 Tax=Thiohalobacter thiocyanaticus TaxID=585455 RepID=A0A1Z4VLW5_9GAMM|nr:alpha/beta fold hydrolase [Thiohalobacter thiocyanaticus]BAZ92442.1 pimeloyl-[acyl-carrier protein] methyl ester esterase [Thiohalobacter thiocyanaticus]